MMPPQNQSRYLAVFAQKDASGRMFLSERSRFAFDISLPGTRIHTVSQGESLHTIAWRYFSPLPDAEHLWWVIAEFQPVPIADLTLDLEIGRTLYIPATRVVQERILGY